MSIELKEGLILKSNDGEYVYNIFKIHPDELTMEVDILDRNLSTLATKPKYSIASFKDQIEKGTIVTFKEDEMIGRIYE